MRLSAGSYMRIRGLCFCLVFVPLSFILMSPIARDDQADHQPLAKGYWVYLKDKAEVVFDPYDFFHPSAIDRRLRHGVDLYDSLDFPVSDIYLSRIDSLVDRVVVVSRWLNAVRVEARPGQLARLKQLPFVEKIQPARLPGQPLIALDAPQFEMPDQAQLKRLSVQLSAMEGQLFHQKGFDGSGIRIAVLDGGFPGVDTHPVFQHLKDNQRIVSTRDFHRGRQDVYRHSAHGTMVLSNLAGIIDSLPMGLATGAEYLLARTETWRELFFEEEYWLAAMEWADQNGAHIINSSVGYTYHRYFPEEMDGQTSLVSQAAAIAFRKGMLVVNAAGNSGMNRLWRIISTPADSPYVLSVGAVSYPTLLRAAYTSRGPAADGRIKPDVTAVGNVLAAGRKGYVTPMGTSFSSPLVAGFAACLWQMFPEWTNADILEALKQSGHLHPYYDFDHGYGIPQAGYFFRPPSMLQTFDFVPEDGKLNVVLRKIIYASEKTSPLDAYLYYNIRNARAEVEQYFVVLAREQQVLSLNIEDFRPGQQVMVHFRGYTSGWTF